MYNKTTEEVLNLVNSASSGLSQQEAKNRLLDNGKNEVKLVKPLTLKDKIKMQLNSVIMFVLLFACITSVVATIMFKNGFMLMNVVLIFVAMLVNVIIGVLSLKNVENTLLNIDNKLKPYTTVKRDGKLIKIKTADLVVGDIIYINEGDVVPADVRIINANNLYICDLLITGESTSINKTDTIINEPNLPLGEQNNMAFLGSNVTKGSATCVVVATGVNTQLGKTTGLMSEEVTLKTPLIKKVESLTTKLSCAVLVLSLVGFLINYFRGGSAESNFMVVVNFAVCIVPEGLIIGIYTNLNRSIKKLNRSGLAVKTLTTMEELGGVDTLLIDKLGVITESRMHVVDVWINNRNDYQVGRNPNFMTLCNAMLLCNNAQLVYNGDQVSALGGNYEVALLNYGMYLGYNKDKFEGLFPRVNEFSFDRDRKMMSTINSVGEKSMVFSKGDFLTVLSKCTTILNEGQPVELTTEIKHQLIHAYQEFVDNGNIVMAFACKEYKGDVYTARVEEVESELTFVGLTAVMPQLKQDVKLSLNKIQKTGVKLLIATSDNAEITYSTALDLGILKSKSQLLTGDQIAKTTDTELKNIITKYTVFAEILPDQKLRIIKALKHNNKIVCVTGDNVTDVNAMLAADVSVGLGIQTSEVVKEKAELVLTNNNLDCLADGITISRRINKNLLKSLQYAFSSTVAQILTLFVILVLLGKTFFSPALLLWLNFFNGLFPCLGLADEKSRTTGYKPIGDDLFSGVSLFNVVTYGTLQSILLIAVYFMSSSYLHYDHLTTITLCFVTLDFLEIFHSYNLKHEVRSLFSTNPFNNRRLNLNILICAVISLIFLCSPLQFFRTYLGVTKLTITEWLACVAVALIIVPLVEIIKMGVRTYYEIKQNKK